jgi:mannose-6-phosphate isomerase-like protein (cupin superfamily)
MKALRVAVESIPTEHWADAARGSIAWQTLLSAGTTASNSLVAGVASLATGDHFALHHHPQAEVYFGLEGAGVVMIDGAPHDLSPGVLLFIPGGAVHGIPPVSGPLRFFYTFAADSFDEVTYSFVQD